MGMNMSPPGVDRRCSICANSYGTRYICSKCRQGIVTYKDKDGTIKTWQDPTLAKEWTETNGRHGVREVGGHEYKATDRPEVFAGKPHVFTLAERGVADCILHGDSNKQIVEKTGLSLRHV